MPSARRIRDEWLDRLDEVRASTPLECFHGLTCAECARVDEGERGWMLRRDVDDDLHAFCPVCDEREFR